MLFCMRLILNIVNNYSITVASIIFEICGIKDFNVIKNALRTGGAKLPLKTKIVY